MCRLVWAFIVHIHLQSLDADEDLDQYLNLYVAMVRSSELLDKLNLLSLRLILREREKASLVWACRAFWWCSQNSMWYTGWWQAGGREAPSWHGRNWQRKTAVSGSSPQLTLKKGAPGDQVWDLLCMQLASYLEGGPLMWMMPLHLHVIKNPIMIMIFPLLKSVCCKGQSLMCWHIWFLQLGSNRFNSLPTCVLCW